AGTVSTPIKFEGDIEGQRSIYQVQSKHAGVSFGEGALTIAAMGMYLAMSGFFVRLAWNTLNWDRMRRLNKSRRAALASIIFSLLGLVIAVWLASRFWNAKVSVTPFGF